MRSPVVGAIALGFLASPAIAGDSYVLPDGTNRAPAVTLHCVTAAGNAVACGTSANPLMVSAPAGIPALPAGGVLTSRTVTLFAGTSTQVFAANSGRRYLSFQVPLSGGVWINVVGGPAAPNGADCAYFAAGSFYESGAFINRGAITVYAAASVTFSAWEN